MRPRRRVAVLRTAIVAPALFGCAKAAPRPIVPPPGAERIAGLWDASFVLERPGPGIANRKQDGATLHSLTGAISFLPLPTPHEAVAGSDRPELATALPVAYAVWEVDFSPAGFDPRAPGRIPDAVAAIDTVASATRTPGDTVRVILGLNGSEAVALAGIWRDDSLVGRWTVVSESRSALSGSGSFTLVPHPRGGKGPG